MNFGNIIKRNDNDYIVFVDLEQFGSGYNVVSKETDINNKYNIEDVRNYEFYNPDKVFTNYNENYEDWLIRINEIEEEPIE